MFETHLCTEPSMGSIYFLVTSLMKIRSKNRYCHDPWTKSIFIISYIYHKSFQANFIQMSKTNCFTLTVETYRQIISRLIIFKITSDSTNLFVRPLTHGSCVIHNCIAQYMNGLLFENNFLKFWSFQLHKYFRQWIFFCNI